ncbi:MAG: hypothetical protein ACR2FS_03970 [Phormidesmis sp.]
MTTSIVGTRTALNKYAKLKRQIIALEAQLKELQPELLLVLSEAGSVSAKNSMFSLKKRKRWTYPAKVLQLAEKLKVAKQQTEAAGTATCTETTYIECKLSDG